jgi:O-antigen ligase
MNDSASPAAPAPIARRRRPAPTDAARMQARLLALALNGLLFLCGLFVWVFKLKGDGTSEGGMLPYSPLQILLPLLGLFSLVWLFVLYHGHFPQIMVRQRSARWLQIGIVLIMCGAALHLRGDGAKEAAMYLVRWMLPVLFLLFLIVARTHGASPLALFFGVACGAFLTAASVEAYRSLGMNLPVTTPVSGRYAGYLGHANQYGIICSTTAPFILYLFYAEYRRGWVGSLVRLFAVLLLPIYLLCLFQNLSKTNIILFFPALLFGSLVLSLKNPRKIIGTMALAAGLAIFVGLTLGLAMNTLQSFSPKAVKVLDNAFSNPAEADTVNSRGEIWATAIQNIKAHPVTGLGPGRALEALGIEHAHNVFLQMYLDAGIAGFCGILCVFWAVFRRTGELIFLELRTRGEIDNDRMLRILSCVAMVTYVFANSMSDSFSSATMPPFIYFAAFAFAPVRKGSETSETPVLEEEASETETTTGSRRFGRRRRAAAS